MCHFSQSVSICREDSLVHFVLQGSSFTTRYPRYLGPIDEILRYLNARECPLGFANIASANCLRYKFDCFKTSVTCWSVKLNFIIIGRVSGHLVKRRVICCVKLGFLISWHSRRNMSNEKCIIALTMSAINTFFGNDKAGIF